MDQLRLQLLYGYLGLPARGRRGACVEDYRYPPICRVRLGRHRLWDCSGRAPPPQREFVSDSSCPAKSLQLGWINVAFLILTTFLGAYILQYIWVQDKAGVYERPGSAEEDI
jgi:hypothetical protein